MTRVPHRLLLVVGLLAFWYYYPLSLCRLVGDRMSMEYDLVAPAKLVLPALAIPFLLLTWRPGGCPRSITIAAAVFVAAVIFGGIKNHTSLAGMLEACSYVLVPLAFALAWQQCGSQEMDRFVLQVCLSGFWAANVFLTFGTGDIDGLCANRNWLAAALLATAPWAAVVTADLAKSTVHKYRSDWRRLQRAIAIAVWGFVCLMTGVVLYRASCKATVMALLGWSALWCMQHRTQLVKRVFLITAVLGLLLALTLGWDKLHRWHASDIRLPLWESTIRMISDAPLLGHGLDEFRKKFMAYKSPDINRRLVAAAVTEHPHNEILNISAGLGIAASLGWLHILLLGCLAAPKSPVEQLSRFSAVVLLVHGCFDKVLSVSPTSVLFPLMLGITLSKFCSLQTSPFPTSERHIRVLTAALVAVLLLVPVGKEVRFRLDFQRAMRDCTIATYLAEQHSSESESIQAAQSAYQYATLASRIGVDRAVSEFEAGLLALEYLNDAPTSLTHFQTVLDEEPDYAFANYFYVRALMLRPKSSEPDELRKVHADALEHLSRDIKNHPYSSFLYEEMIRVLLQAGQFEQAVKWNVRLENLLRERCELDAFVDGQKLSDRIWRWRSTLDAAEIVTNGVQTTTLPNVELVELFKSHPLCKNFLTNTSYTSEDVWFWQEMDGLLQDFESVRSLDELFDKLRQIKVRAHSEKELVWPGEVWQRKQSDAISAACFASFIGRLLNYSCLIVPDRSAQIVIFRRTNELGFWKTSESKGLVVPPSEAQRGWRVLLHDRCGIPATEPLKGFAFFYPHEFRELNHALGTLRSMDQSSVRLVFCPAAVRSNEKIDFGTAAPDGYWTEPFDRLELDLQR